MQKEQQNLKTLCDIIEIEPTDEEGSETQYDVGIKFSHEYDLLEIHTNFGNDNFKEIYLDAISRVKLLSLPIQMTLCRKLLNKVTEVYDFIFPEQIVLVNQNDMNSVFELVEFLQFDNLQFMINVWKAFNVKNIMNIDVEVFMTRNDDVNERLLEQITNNSLMYSKKSLINIFLNTCEADWLLFMFVDMTEKNKAMITVNLMKGELS